MKIINCTPHTITLHGNDIPCSGMVARCGCLSEKVGWISDMSGEEIPIVRNTYGEIYDLPPYDATSDEVYVVSRIVAEAAKAQGRNDCYVVADTVRDENGVIVGAMALAQV